MNADKDSGAFPVRLRFDTPSDVVSRYATNFVAQHTANEFILSFYEVCPPMLFGTPEEIRHAVENTEFIPATCVARIVTSPAGMKDLIRILQTNLERFERIGQEDD